MKVVATSDFHGCLPEDVPACDLLLVAGDVLGAGGPEVDQLHEWLDRQPAETIVGIAGNHDFVASEQPEIPRGLPWIYLDNESAVVDGVPVFGSPYASLFGGWAFMEPDDVLAEMWAKIPADTEILVVHGPARGINDLVGRGEHTGSISLRERLYDLPQLRLLVTGHIHEEYGERWVHVEKFRYLRCVNASYMDARYRPVNPPIVIEL